jgi:hypothetical protein
MRRGEAHMGEGDAVLVEEDHGRRSSRSLREVEKRTRGKEARRGTGRNRWADLRRRVGLLGLEEGKERGKDWAREREPKGEGRVLFLFRKSFSLLFILGKLF